MSASRLYKSKVKNLEGFTGSTYFQDITGDEESLVAALVTIKWGKTGYQAMLTIEETLGPGQVRWNVAMSFARYGCNKQWEKALEILTRLAADERRYVWRAVASALRYIGRRRPEQVCPILEEWLDNERRRRPATIALKYIQ